MAARKKKSAKKTARKKSGAKRRPSRGRKPAAKKRAGRRKPARKPARRPAAKKRPAKKAPRKSVRKSAKKPSKPGVVLPPVRIIGGRAFPGTLPAKRGDTVTWKNEDGTSYGIHFDESPFLPGRRSQDIPVDAYGTSEPQVVHKAKAKANYGYDIRGSKAEVPPGEPQVTIED